MKEKVFFGEMEFCGAVGRFTVLFSWAPCLLEGGFNCNAVLTCRAVFCLGEGGPLQARPARFPGRGAVCSCHNLTVGAT